MIKYKHMAIFLKIFLLCSSLRSQAYSKTTERDRYMLYCFNIMKDDKTLPQCENSDYLAGTTEGNLTTGES